MPYWDDWGIAGFLHSFLNGEIGFADFFAPVNEHRMLFNRLISVFVFNLNQQQWDPMVMMIINSGLWTLCGLLLLTIAKTHQKEFKPLAFVVLILAIWLYPVSPVNTLWGVQTHNYMMILLSVSGCWFINQKALSGLWWLGLACLFCAGLSMAGGSFAAVAVVVVFALICITDQAQRKDHLITLFAATLAAAFGLSLIYLQSASSPPSGETFNLVNSALTFAKSMSWPKTPNAWPFLIFLIPPVWLLLEILMRKSSPSALVRFTLCLYLFVTIIALAIAVARAFNGEGPSRRYLEFLALGSIASALALLLIQTETNTIKKSLILAWVIIFVSALPFQIEIMRYTLKDRQETVPFQTENVRQFIFQEDESALNDKAFRHIPFHNGQMLANAFIELEKSDILPYQLQKPEPLITQTAQNRSVFKPNNSYLFYSKIAGVDYFGAPMLGSYTTADGMKAVGDFTSQEFELTRPYMMIPSLGFLGLHELSLTLVNSKTGAQRILIPEKVGMESADQWLDNFYAVTPGKYRLIAHDQNTDLWFGFAAPRTVGRMSYLAQQLLERGGLFWQIGLILFIFSQRKALFNIFSSAKQ